MAVDIKLPHLTTSKELGDLTVCALRYCFGRRTYLPSAVDAAKANWSLLPDNDKTTIKRDVAEALQIRNMGMDCDIEMWACFYEWILIEESKGNETV